MLDQSSTLCLKTSTTWARVCDTCRSAPCTIYCRTDSAYLCTACDARIHAGNKFMSSRHERVWVCEACEQAPAAFICKADAASLCTTCDADIHSANPLARRHHRSPVMPIPGALYGPPATVMGLEVESQSGFMSQAEDAIDDGEDEGEGEDEDEDEAASWLLFDGPLKNNQNQNGKENGFLFNGDGGDEYLEFMEFGDDQQQCYKVPEKMYGGGDADSVVPVQKSHHLHHHHQFHQQDLQNNQKFQLGMEYESLSGAGYGYTPSLSHSVSMSSMEVGVVPDSTRSEVSISHPRHTKGTIDLFLSPPVQMPTQLTAMDREARVMRYREKKKTRKFEKTIRYASRKAYAETRPRIKGRFAKRTNSDLDVDQMFPTNHMIEGGYGIVPSF